MNSGFLCAPTCIIIFGGLINQDRAWHFSERETKIINGMEDMFYQKKRQNKLTHNSSKPTTALET